MKRNDCGSWPSPSTLTLHWPMQQYYVTQSKDQPWHPSLLDHSIWRTMMNDCSVFPLFFVGWRSEGKHYFLWAGELSPTRCSKAMLHVFTTQFLYSRRIIKVFTIQDTFPSGQFRMSICICLSSPFIACCACMSSQILMDKAKKKWYSPIWHLVICLIPCAWIQQIGNPLPCCQWGMLLYWLWVTMDVLACWLEDIGYVGGASGEQWHSSTNHSLRTNQLKILWNRLHMWALASIKIENPLPDGYVWVHVRQTSLSLPI